MIKYKHSFPLAARLIVTTAIAVLLAVSVAMAATQPTSASLVGDTVEDPVTGESVQVISLLQSGGVTYAVVTSNNALIYTTFTVNDVLPDPTGNWTVGSVSTNASTGLVDSVNLSRVVSDGTDSSGNPISHTETSTLSIVSDQSAAAAAAAAAAAGAAADPGGDVTPPARATGDINNYYDARRKGAGGSNGNNGYGVRICDPFGVLGCATIGYSGTAGGNGSTGPTVNDTISSTYGNIQTVSPGLAGIDVASIGGNGGKGGTPTGRCPDWPAATPAPVVMSLLPPMPIPPSPPAETRATAFSPRARAARPAMAVPATFSAAEEAAARPATAAR